MNMQDYRWTNPHQPQTLQIAVILLYINAVFSLLYSVGGAFNSLGTLIFFLVAVPLPIAAGLGVANEKKWGYALAILSALMPFLIRLAFGLSLVGGSIINLMFEVALVALVLHPESRSYAKLWFK